MNRKKQTEPLLEVEVSNVLKLKGDVKPAVIKDLKNELTIETPKWMKNQNSGEPTSENDLYLKFLEKKEDGWVMPRGFFERLIAILNSHVCPIKVDFKSKITKVPTIDFNFLGELRKEQQRAADEGLLKNFGILSLPEGTGKSSIALSRIFHKKEGKTSINVI